MCRQVRETFWFQFEVNRSIIDLQRRYVQQTLFLSGGLLYTTGVMYRNGTERRKQTVVPGTASGIEPH